MLPELPVPALPPCICRALAATVCMPVPLLPIVAQLPAPRDTLHVAAVPLPVPPIKVIVPDVDTNCVPEFEKMLELFPAVFPPRTVMEPLWPGLPTTRFWFTPPVMKDVFADDALP